MLTPIAASIIFGTPPVHPIKQKNRTMTDHTPGPWKARGPRIYDANGEEVAVATRASPVNRKYAEETARRIAFAAPGAAVEIDRVKTSNGDLVDMLKTARECIAYCRRNHPDAQKGEGIPVEILIDAAIAVATKETPT